MSKIKISYRALGWLLMMMYCLACNHIQERITAISIVIGTEASSMEKRTAEDLKKDLEQVSGLKVPIITDTAPLSSGTMHYILGTTISNARIKQLIKAESLDFSSENPGARGGIWHKTTMGEAAVILLAGADEQGAQYAVYDYSHEVLGIDPYAYWTDAVPKQKSIQDIINIKNRLISPPLIPIMGYFENDVDELANLKAPLLEYDWESYTEMIDALVRLKYNAIQLFDMLGRPEFFLRPEYKAIRPDYDIDIAYIEKMIDYAQSRGMKVQIDMALAYKINPMDEEKASCWKKYKEDWIEKWRYYLEKTPLGKADIFMLRPRNQVWDWEYKSTCGENKIDVFNEAYAEFGKLVDRYRPEAIKVVICYADGMEMFNNGLNPPKDFIIAWSDDGWGGFEHLPDSTRGYQFGTYMHAGFWLNHTVHDPYPEKIDSVMNMMFDQYQATAYCLVNGQQFRPFLLNLEAFSQVCQWPKDFDGAQFYHDWASRYFDNANTAVEAMKLLHAAQFENIGYVEHLWEIREVIAYLSDSPIERPGKTPIPSSFASLEKEIPQVHKRLEILDKALQVAQSGLDKAGANSQFYHDFVYLPIQLYHDLIAFEHTLHQLALLKKSSKDKAGNQDTMNKTKKLLSDARSKLSLIHERRNKGDQNPKWATWYHISKRRPNNGFPTMEMMDKVEKALLIH